MIFLYKFRAWFIMSFFLGLINTLDAQQSALERTNSFSAGKRFLEQGLYSKSIQKLKPLIIGSSKNRYNYSATYLYAVASFHIKDYYQTQVACENIMRTYPTKKGNDEVIFLWSQSLFKQKKYDKGYQTLKKLKKPEAFKGNTDKMKKSVFLEEQVEKLSQLAQTYPHDKVLANVLLFKKVTKATAQKDWDALDILLDRSTNSEEKGTNNIVKMPTEEPASAYKDVYTVALVFPFNLHDEKNASGTRRPRPAQFAYDLFTGLKLAQKKLKRKDIQLDIRAFDTKDDSLEVQKILRSSLFSTADLIIEPSATKFTPILAEYAKSKHIGLINILSFRPDLKDYPNLFSILPSYETQAQQTLAFVQDSLPAKRAYIYYGEGRRDSLVAYAYKKLVEESAGTVVVFKKIKHRRSSYYSFSREMRGEPRGAGRSKAHFFVCSSDQSLAINLLTAMQTSKVFAPIFATEEWLHYPVLSMEQYEATPVYFILPHYINKEGLYVKQFEQVYYGQTKLIPSRYAFIGYETGYFFGSILKRYGTGFYRKIHENKPEEGILMPQLDYRNGNDNQFVPICRFVEGKFQMVNLNKQ